LRPISINNTKVKDYYLNKVKTVRNKLRACRHAPGVTLKRSKDGNSLTISFNNTIQYKQFRSAAIAYYGSDQIDARTDKQGAHVEDFISIALVSIHLYHTKNKALIQGAGVDMWLENDFTLLHNSTTSLTPSSDTTNTDPFVRASSVYALDKLDSNYSNNGSDEDDTCEDEQQTLRAICSKVLKSQSDSNLAIQSQEIRSSLSTPTKSNDDSLIKGRPSRLSFNDIYSQTNDVSQTCCKHMIESPTISGNDISPTAIFLHESGVAEQLTPCDPVTVSTPLDAILIENISTSPSVNANENNKLTTCQTQNVLYDQDLVRVFEDIFKQLIDSRVTVIENSLKLLHASFIAEIKSLRDENSCLRNTILELQNIYFRHE
jgi:hypothetical protein